MEIPRKPAKTFTDLIVWQKAHALTLAVYRASESFPRHEIYGLTSQIRRAVVSIPANISEGFRKQTRPDKARILNVSEGSLEECRYYFILTRDLGYLPDKSFNELWERSDEIGKLLCAYRSSILASIS